MLSTQRQREALRDKRRIGAHAVVLEHVSSKPVP